MYEKHYIFIEKCGVFLLHKPANERSSEPLSLKKTDNTNVNYVHFVFSYFLVKIHEKTG